MGSKEENYIMKNMIIKFSEEEKVKNYEMLQNSRIE